MFGRLRPSVRAFSLWSNAGCLPLRSSNFRPPLFRATQLRQPSVWRGNGRVASPCVSFVRRMSSGAPSAAAAPPSAIVPLDLATRFLFKVHPDFIHEESIREANQNAVASLNNILDFARHLRRVQQQQGSAPAGPELGWSGKMPPAQTLSFYLPKPADGAASGERAAGDYVEITAAFESLPDSLQPLIHTLNVRESAIVAVDKLLVTLYAQASSQLWPGDPEQASRQLATWRQRTQDHDRHLGGGGGVGPHGLDPDRVRTRPRGRRPASTGRSMFPSIDNEGYRLNPDGSRSQANPYDSKVHIPEAMEEERRGFGSRMNDHIRFSMEDLHRETTDWTSQKLSFRHQVGGKMRDQKRLIAMPNLTPAQRQQGMANFDKLVRDYWRAFEHIPWDKLRILLASEFMEPADGWWVIKWNTSLRDFVAYMLPETRAQLLEIIRLRREEERRKLTLQALGVRRVPQTALPAHMQRHNTQVLAARAERDQLAVSQLQQQQQLTTGSQIPYRKQRQQQQQQKSPQSPEPPAQDPLDGKMPRAATPLSKDLDEVHKLRRMYAISQQQRQSRQAEMDQAHREREQRDHYFKDQLERLYRPKAPHNR